MTLNNKLTTVALTVGIAAMTGCCVGNEPNQEMQDSLSELNLLRLTFNGVCVNGGVTDGEYAEMPRSQAMCEIVDERTKIIEYLGCEDFSIWLCTPVRSDYRFGVSDTVTIMEHCESGGSWTLNSDREWKKYKPGNAEVLYSQ
jgi:hypothetical protein